MFDVFIAQLNYNARDVRGNFEKILAGYEKAVSSGARIMLLSRCAISGYLDKAPLPFGEFTALYRKYLENLASHTLNKQTCIVVGGVERRDAQLCEVIYLLSGGTIRTLMHIPKRLRDAFVMFSVSGLTAALLLEESPDVGARWRKYTIKWARSTDTNGKIYAWVAKCLILVRQAIW
ncbi:nitrilase-related carbon-nitrogen hydrolase [Anaplasma marginale]|uniref:nitrilase-related carbon-nitrogen hydrolase n=1 Tax=Anaplasma marginale TaxID=770 RepID=UPI000304768B|nr:nitrilase-related carbon-nitrogen hydrolase [Anaplasma marginale]